MLSNQNHTSCTLARALSAISAELPANTNISPTEIEACLKANANNFTSGKPPRRQKQLWEGFGDTQLTAARHIYLGFQLRYGGVGLRTQSYSVAPRVKRYGNDHNSELDELFSIWARTAFAENVSVGAVLDILVFGKSCREIDRYYAKRKGFARKNLESGLDMYRGLRQEYTIMEKNT